MGLFKFKTAIAGLSSVLAASYLYANFIDEKVNDNENNLEQYWYYYDDNAGIGENDRPQKAPELEASIIQTPYTETTVENFGTKSISWKLKTYQFKADESEGKQCATLPFKMGEPWEAGYCQEEACAMPFVGIGTMLAADSQSLDLSAVTGIKFKIKSRVNELTEVRFKVQTLQVDQFANKAAKDLTGKEFGYWGYDFTVNPGTWQEKEILFDKLNRPSWAEKIDFDQTKCTKLAWEIKGDDSRMVDTLDIAELEFIGGDVWPKSLWRETEDDRPADGWFHTFDVKPYNEAKTGYWYAYNDAEIGGESEVSEETATKNETTKKLNILFPDGTGWNDKGKGAALEFEIGKAVYQKTADGKDSNLVKGFVGIGINMYDSLGCSYTDMTTGDYKASSIYFEYMTDMDAAVVTLEISDENDVADKEHPDRKNERGSGIVYYKNFPNTEGKWVRVLLPFDELVVRDGWKGYNPIPFDRSKIAKLQWKVQDAPGSTGIFAVDNIAFPGSKWKVDAPDPDAVKNIQSMLAKNGFAANYKNGNILVNWNNNFSNGKINVVNLNGAVVKSVSVSSAKSLSTSISANKLSAGIYMVKMTGVGINGKTIEKQSSINIVK